MMEFFTAIALMELGKKIKSKVDWFRRRLDHIVGTIILLNEYYSSIGHNFTFDHKTQHQLSIAVKTSFSFSKSRKFNPPSLSLSRGKKLKRSRRRRRVTLSKNEDQNISNDTWKSVPTDIMEGIALHFSSTDYIHSSMVCKSWHVLLLQSDIVRPKVLWLLLPHHSTRDAIQFYNVLEDKFHTIVLPKVIDGSRAFVGCSKGWIIFMDKDTFEISLFNPISRVEYFLPSSPIMFSLQRVELSSSNISKCTVAAIFDGFGKLALCILGDKRWEVLSISSGVEQNCTLIDILFCRHQLHALIKSESGEGKIEDIVVKLPNKREVIPITLVHDVDNRNKQIFEVGDLPHFFGFRVFQSHFYNSYLAESIKGQVILVQKHYNSFFVLQQEQVDIVHEFFDITNSYIDEEEEEENNGNHNKRRKEKKSSGMTLKHVTSDVDGFKIYLIEDLANSKKDCKNLGEEQALFLSSKSRLCLPSTTNKLQGNGIHFIVDHPNVDDDHHGSYLIDINGVYRFDNSSVQSLIPEFEYAWHFDMMWFVPNLRCGLL